jgi:hypothetical protein
MSFITNGGSYEWKITNGNRVYGAENLSGGKLIDKAYEQLSIGNVIARQLELKMWEVSLDPAYPIELALEATTYEGTTTTIGKGTYFIDTIEASPYSDYAVITAYDALLKADVPYMKSGTWTAVLASEVASQIATDIGVTIEEQTLAYILGNPKTIDQVPSIGDNGTTERELLSVIGVMYGGNWIINDANELELVQLGGRISPTVNLVTIDSNGLFYAKPYGAVQPTETVVTVNSSGNFVSALMSAVTSSTVLWYIGTDGMNYTDTWANIQALPSGTYPSVVIGDEVAEFDVSPTETITRVELWEKSSKSYRSPEGLTESEWEALGGIVLSAQMPLMASQSLADELYTRYNGFTYIPYTAESAYFDPETALGTTLEIKDDTVILSNRTLDIGVLAPSDLSADPTQELKSYYPKLSPFERGVQQDIEESYARITTTNDEIQAEVRRAKQAESDLGTTITTTAKGLRVALNDYKKEVASYLSYENGTLTLGESDSNFKAQLTNQELAFTGSDGQKAAWISNTQMNIEEAVIQRDEKFVATGGNWVQQTVNNHFQIKWVGN